MNVNSMATVASALIAVYVLLALITAQFAEAYSSLVQQRGKLLYESLQRSLNDAASDAAPSTPAPESSTLAEKLYAHPLIAGLGGTNRKPSYIPTRTLTLSLVSVLGELAHKPAVDLLKSSPQELLERLLSTVTVLREEVGAAKGLAVVLQTARSDYSVALKAIDAWFECQLDRVSGAYKRWIFVVQMLFAALIVILLNADTLTIVQGLSRSSTITTALGSSTASTSETQSVADQLRKLSTTGLDLGWPDGTTASTVLSARKVGGLLLTWSAALLGAPFWFDILKKVAPVRLTGNKPADPKTATTDAQSRPVAK